MMASRALRISPVVALAAALCGAPAVAAEDHLAQRYSASCLRPGGGSSSGSEFRLVSWEMPAQAAPGQTVTSRIIWETERGNPNAVIYASVIGDWAPSSPIAILVDGGLQGRPGNRFERQFRFTAPRAPGTYRVRWILTQAFAPLTEFYGRSSGDVHRPPGGTWSQAEFVVADGSAPQPAPAPGAADRIVSRTWHAGTWDATIYNRSHRPKTVGVRLEVVDAETRLPLAGIPVALKGHYLERRGGAARADDGGPWEPQQREFSMEALTGADGVVVFALQWQKEYPWSQGERPRTYDGRGGYSIDPRDVWIKPVDDVEKVQWIEIRHPQYAYAEIPFSFRHLLEFGQDPDSAMQEIRLFGEFEAAWEAEVRRPEVVFCILNLGTAFPDFENKSSRRPEFFERIRRRDFGAVYSQPHNSFGRGEYPQSICGPYFVYQLEVGLERRSGQLDVNLHGPAGSGGGDRDSDRSDDGRRGSQRTGEGEARRHETEQRQEQRRAGEAHQRAEHAGAQQAREAEQRQRAEEERAREARQRALAEKAAGHPLGLAVETLTDDNRQRLGLYLGTRGVVVLHVMPGSAADQAGLRVGMVIESVEQRIVGDEAEFDRRTGRKRAGDQFVMGIWRKAGSQWERANRMITVPR